MLQARRSFTVSPNGHFHVMYTHSLTPHLSLGQLQQLAVLLRMRLFHISFCHLLHHEIPVNLHVLDQLAVCDAPLARDGQRADGRLGVDQCIDAGGNVGEGQFVCRLINYQLHLEAGNCREEM
jgi:hypothetical protein